MDDLISREYVLGALGIFKDGDRHFLNGIETAKEIVQDAPAVDAIPVYWLREKLTNHTELPYSATDAINAVLDMWTNEQEAR